MSKTPNDKPTDKTHKTIGKINNNSTFVRGHNIVKLSEKLIHSKNGLFIKVYRTERTSDRTDISFVKITLKSQDNKNFDAIVVTRMKNEDEKKKKN